MSGSIKSFSVATMMTFSLFEKRSSQTPSLKDFLLHLFSRSISWQQATAKLPMMVPLTSPLYLASSVTRQPSNCSQSFVPSPSWPVQLVASNGCQYNFTRFGLMKTMALEDPYVRWVVFRWGGRQKMKIESRKIKTRAATE